jgi:hypothetical protein
MLAERQLATKPPTHVPSSLITTPSSIYKACTYIQIINLTNLLYGKYLKKYITKNLDGLFSKSKFFISNSLFYTS